MEKQSGKALFDRIINSIPNLILNKIPNRKSVLLTVMGLLFATTASQAATLSCQEELELYNSMNPGACGYTNTSRFSLDQDATITRVSVWYNANRAGENLEFTLHDAANAELLTGTFQASNCDPYQSQWCSGEFTLNQSLTAGTYAIRAAEQAVCQNSTSGGNGFAVVKGCDQVQAVDHSSTAWQVTEIYLATMGYAPDAEGLNYWVDRIDNDPAWTPTTVAQSFFDQPLVQQAYPPSLGAGALIDALYQNIFGRPADATGRAYWLEGLESGQILRNQMIIALINGGWDNPEATADMARFGHRIEASLAFAAHQDKQGIFYTKLSVEDQLALREAGRQLVANITADVATRDAAIARVGELLAGLSDSKTGALTVTLEPAEARAAGAQWRRTTTQAWLDSGATETGIPTGGQTVGFKAISNWTAPSDAAVSIIAGQTTTLTGRYEQAGAVDPLTRLEIESVLEEEKLAQRDTSVISADLENRLAKAVAKANEADFQTKVLFNAFFMASPQTPRDHLLNTYHALTKSFEIAAKKNAEIIDIHEQIEALLGEKQGLKSNALNVSERLQWYLDNFRNTTIGGRTINIATIAEMNNISHERVHVLLRTHYGVIADQEEATAIQYEAAEKTAVEIKQASDAANNVLSVVAGGQAAYGAIKAAKTGYTAYKMYRAGNLAYNTTAHIARTQGFSILKGSADGIFGVTGGVLGLLTDPNINETLGLGEEINEKLVNANNIFSVLNTAKTLVDARSIFSIKDPFTGNSKLVISNLTDLTKFVVDLEPENLILGLYQTKDGGLEFKSEILKKGDANEKILAELLQQRQLKPEDLLPNGQYVLVDDEDGTEETIRVSASGVNALLTNLDEEDRLFGKDGGIVDTESPVDDFDPCRPFGLATVVACGMHMGGTRYVPVSDCINVWGGDLGWCCSGRACADPCHGTNPPGFEVCSGS